MMKCELCKSPASLYCNSDQANLCTKCDAKVHKANFLVARHSRTLLCRTCQSRTPWTASGAKLGNTTTECEKCVGQQNEISTDEEDEVSFAMSGSEDEEVVPWFYTPISLSLIPPAASSSSSSYESITSSLGCDTRRVLVKRKRECICNVKATSTKVWICSRRADERVT